MKDWPQRADPLHDGGPLPLYCPKCGRPTEPHAIEVDDGDAEYRYIVCWAGVSRWIRWLFTPHYEFCLGRFIIDARFDPLTGKPR